MGYKEDKELNTYRNLIEVPENFEEGFGVKTIIGALFLGLLVTPGSIYIMLVAGEGVGPAARWVTIFLFSEVARRSLKEMRQQEVFVLYYMTGHVLVSPAMMMMSPLWKVYMIDSDAFKSNGISEHIPHWVVPGAQYLADRDMFTAEWLPAIALIAITMTIAKIDHFGLGYFLYRLTSDVERLPFPMAPIGASGILAMAETKDKTLQWRPACFSIGGVLGLLFGVLYLGVPAVTSIVLREPVYIIPIPWIEMTSAFKDSIPAMAINIVPNLAMFVLGMVLPFWAIVGGFLGLVLQMFMNPILYNGGILASGGAIHKYTGFSYNGGILHHWRPGMETVETIFNNSIDFYFSFTLGITFFIAFLGFWQALYPMIKKKLRGTAQVALDVRPEISDDTRSKWQILTQGNPKRGDISIWISLAIYVSTTISYIGISCYLVDGFPIIFFLVYGFIYTPLMGYAAAKVEGLAGQNVTVPMVKEAMFILSGYKGVAIWYAPIPGQNYSWAVKDFRIIELTGTRLRSVILTDIITLPIIVASLILFSGLIWSQADLNSDQYPYVQRVWDLMAKNRALMISSTLEGKRSLFFEALRGEYIAAGAIGAGLLYSVLSLFGLPVLLVFGMVRGLGMTNPATLVPQLLGALVGRYYFKKKFGDMWTKYTPGIFAGFTCGVGLIGMIAVAIRLIAKSIAPLQY